MIGLRAWDKDEELGVVIIIYRPPALAVEDRRGGRHVHWLCTYLLKLRWHTLRREFKVFNADFRLKFVSVDIEEDTERNTEEK